MIDSALTKKRVPLKVKITIKTLVSLGIIAVAVALPQIVHLIAGAQGGARLLPMYLPVIIGGCLMGARWGVGIAIASPLISFCITYAIGDPMPAAARLPFMIAELVIYALVSGAFSKKIVANAWTAFPAVLFAHVAGRAAFMLLAVIFNGVSPLSPYAVWSQIQVGFVGVIAQAVVVPLIVIAMRYMIVKDKGND